MELRDAGRYFQIYRVVRIVERKELAGAGIGKKDGQHHCGALLTNLAARVEDNDPEHFFGWEIRMALPLLLVIPTHVCLHV